LQELGIAPKDFNSYGSRRGNHEVMVRGTFANIRLRNQLAPGTEGGVTRHFGAGSERPQSAAEEVSIYDAAMRYMREGVPLVVIAGKEYGSGSSRDWAAKGTKLLGVRAVIAGSFERIHRSNLIGMGVLPLQFPEGESAQSLGLSGEEIFSIEGLAAGFQAGGGSPPREVIVRAERPRAASGGGAGGGDAVQFNALVRIDTPREAEYFRHGGILQYVLRALLAG
jgi:aconitate hydratase